MKLKHILAVLTALSMTLSLAACTGKDKPETQKEAVSTEQSAEQPAEKTDEKSTEKTEPTTEESIQIRLAALKGPTALGMVELLEQNEQGKSANQDEITGKIISGELDVAAVPTNLASVLYNKTEGQVQLAALNTMGVLYVLETGDTIHSVADLAG